MFEMSQLRSIFLQKLRGEVCGQAAEIEELKECTALVE
jgi:hypothetical protein